MTVDTASHIDCHASILRVFATGAAFAVEVLRSYFLVDTKQTKQLNPNSGSDH